ncbi:ATP-grasp ribosomal peptide maturase [Actinomadura sp. KC216]|uniref:ATP-grasp ribosomal peptide maturase n=1 Tax=Actinomadura sp. KC216 TaxID=2530370 RepID=UPI001048CBB3|nr:ATP-grasp ribosomal peptide maturase [Actinomadura sp. KC216]TDB82903.1 ATP-grasp ribosomal peptide maturase [Actinomadura sp. KC216]
MASAAAWRVTIIPDGTVLDLADVAAVFYRQSQPFTVPEGLSGAEERFARVEGRFGLRGLLASLPVRWVPGRPGRVADSEYKPLQLATAARCGLPVTSTVLTNDPDYARSFAGAHEPGVVYKALMHKAIADDGDVRLILTAPVTPADIDDRVGMTMHQFQANLADVKEFDARLLVTRHGQIGVAIKSEDPHARQDFRARYDALTYQIVNIPADIAEGCRRYLRSFELELGVLDFCVAARGWHFQECGPGAQWAWLQETTGAAMDELVTKALIGDVDDLG